jgi:hypothetical protein
VDQAVNPRLLSFILEARMYNTYADLVDSLSAAPEILTALLHNCSQEQAQAARGGDEGWSVVEVICHLRDAEERALARNRLMRDQDNPPVLGYDQEELARAGNYAAADLREALASFIRLRTTNVNELAALTPEQWQRPGVHSDLGPISISAHMAHMASHDAVHCAQIARQLGLAG